MRICGYADVIVENFKHKIHGWQFGQGSQFQPVRADSFESLQQKHKLHNLKFWTGLPLSARKGGSFKSLHRIHKY
jgi:hypothetical protein